MFLIFFLHKFTQNRIEIINRIYFIGPLRAGYIQIIKLQRDDFVC